MMPRRAEKVAGPAGDGMATTFPSFSGSPSVFLIHGRGMV